MKFFGNEMLETEHGYALRRVRITHDVDAAGRQTWIGCYCAQFMPAVYTQTCKTPQKAGRALELKLSLIATELAEAGAKVISDGLET